MSTKRPKKPCEQPCTKCGSADVYRRHRLKGEEYETRYGERGKLRSPWIAERPHWGKEFARECIVHHCRTCQFEWCTAPLKAAA